MIVETASIFKLSFYNIRYYTPSKKDEIKYSGIGIEFSYSKIMTNFEATLLKCMITNYKYYVMLLHYSTILTTANGKTKKAACVCVVIDLEQKMEPKHYLGDFCRK